MGKQKRIVEPIQENPHLGKIEDVLEQFRRMIYKFVNRYQAKAFTMGVEYEDLASIAHIGFLKAYNNYDPTKFDGQVTKFSTYLVPMLKGEILRELRDTNQSGLKISRLDKQNAEKIMRNGLEHLDPDEIAVQLSISPAAAEVALQCVYNSKVDSLQATVFHSDGDEITLEDQVESPEDFSSMYVEEFLNSLSEKNRKVAELAYLKGKTQAEIGEEMGVSQVQVSRILTKIKKIAENHFFEGKREVKAISKKKRIKLKAPKEVVEKRRLEAKRLLAETDMTLGEVALATKLGYTSIAGFAQRIRGKGNVRRGGDGRPLKYGTKEALEIAKRLVEETDFSYKIIAEETGVAYHTVSCHGRKVRGKAKNGGWRTPESEVSIRQLTPEERIKYGIDKLKTPAEEKPERSVADPAPIPFIQKVPSKRKYRKKLLVHRNQKALLKAV